MRWLLLVALLAGLGGYLVAEFHLGTEALPPAPAPPIAGSAATGALPPPIRPHATTARPVVASSWITRSPILTGVVVSLSVLGYAGLLVVADRHSRR